MALSVWPENRGGGTLKLSILAAVARRNEESEPGVESSSVSSAALPPALDEAGEYWRPALAPDEADIF